MPVYTVTGGRPVLVTRFHETSSYDGGELARSEPVRAEPIPERLTGYYPFVEWGEIALGDREEIRPTPHRLKSRKSGSYSRSGTKAISRDGRCRCRLPALYELMAKGERECIVAASELRRRWFKRQERKPNGVQDR